ncbi:hypothetical protein ABW21_db0204031 [Orbilia brochopaga]|nr:hypothetical protein ABW21_db0204031 [Drechslerella brochopaga]
MQARRHIIVIEFSYAPRWGRLDGLRSIEIAPGGISDAQYLKAALEAQGPSRRRWWQIKAARLHSLNVDRDLNLNLRRAHKTFQIDTWPREEWALLYLDLDLDLDPSIYATPSMVAASLSALSGLLGVFNVDAPLLTGILIFTALLLNILNFRLARERT